MITETTWGSTGKQTNFVWTATVDGIDLYHGNKAPPYTIPWKTFGRVLTQARLMASKTPGNQIVAGVDFKRPASGSVGEWVNTKKLPISSGTLTPKHLSFIGPILGRMHLATRSLSGKKIIWCF
jgi:hypothetical protein